MLSFVVSQRMLVASAAVGALFTACGLLTGLIVTPLALAATFATSFAAVFGVIALGVNVAISRMDFADNINDTEELAQIALLQQREWQRRCERPQAIAPGQQAAHLLQHEIAAGNPMWAFMAPKPTTALSPSDPKTAPDIEGYMVGGHNLRKRKN